MTLVLKSDVLADNFIMDKHGYKGPSDYKAFLDFELSDYSINGVSENVNGLLRVNNKNSISWNQYGEPTVLDDNTPAIGCNANYDAYGLIIEPTMTNFYFPALNPVSKNIDLLQGTTEYVCVFEGTGSVTIAGASLAKTLVLKGGEAQILNSTSPSSIPTVSVTVTGEVKNLSVLAAGFLTNALVKRTLINSKFSTWWAPFEECYFSDKLNNLIKDSSSFSVVFQFVDNEQYPIYNMGTVYKPLIEFINGTTTLTLIKRKNNDNSELVSLRLYTGVETVIDIPLVTRGSVFAITVTANGVTLAVDGKVVGKSQVLTNFKSLLCAFGFSPNWLKSFNNAANGCFTKLAVYDRALSDLELQDASTSF